MPGPPQRHHPPGHVRAVLRHPGFLRLLGARLIGQFGDGVFQVSLAGAVLFNPDRAARPADVAAGFAVLLLPYSLLGPFIGVLLDRWSRRHLLVWTDVARALVVVGVAAEVAAGLGGFWFYGSALVAISAARFVNSALSAAQPHVVDAPDLVTANALATTAGTVATTLGGGAALGLRAMTGATDGGYAAVAASAMVFYLVAAFVAAGFGAAALGPDERERGHRETVRAVVAGLLAGARHVRTLPRARDALAAITVGRICFGLWTVTTLLLYRNAYHPDGPFRSGLAGLTQIVIAVGIGGGLAAFVTPVIARRVGYRRWPAALLIASAAVMLACSLPYHPAASLLGALLLGFTAQGVKISVDTIVQSDVDDEFRGRVFAVYDALFNVALVLAAVLTAVALPATGRSPATVVAVSVAYAACGLGYLAGTGRDHAPVSPPAAARRTTG